MSCRGALLGSLGLAIGLQGPQCLASHRSIRVDRPSQVCLVGNWSPNGTSNPDPFALADGFTPGGANGGTDVFSSCFGSGDLNPTPNVNIVADDSSVFITNDNNGTPYSVAANAAYYSSLGLLATAGEMYSWVPTGTIANDDNVADFEAIVWTLPGNWHEIELDSGWPGWCLPGATSGTIEFNGALLSGGCSSTAAYDLLFSDSGLIGYFDLNNNYVPLTAGTAPPGWAVSDPPDTYDSATGQLSIPQLAIGNVTYSNVVLTVGKILSGPSGGAATTTGDTYDPVSGRLSVARVNVGTRAFYNVSVSVAHLVSIGGVTGADRFDGASLEIGSVQLLGGSTYENVVITVGEVLGVAGGMPGHAQDEYSPGNHELAIPAVEYLGKVYTNVTITLGTLQSVNAATATVRNVVGDLQADATSALTAAGLGVGSVTNQWSSTVAPGYVISESPVAGAVLAPGATVDLTVSSGALLPESILYSFAGQGTVAGATDGSGPQAALIEAMDGNFYGVTYQGGAFNSGTVFRISPTGNEAVVYSFQGGPAGLSGSLDGGEPQASLVQTSNGNFWGTTGDGGKFGVGTVFELTPGISETALYPFSGGVGGSQDGASPGSNLILGADGNFYGTTGSGGTYNAGTVFSITTNGTEIVLHSFTGGPSGAAGSTDGAQPPAGLVQGPDGTFYGTTAAGGAFNAGTVFKISAGGSETVLYSFNGIDGYTGVGQSGSLDGAYPQAGLILASDGYLYGTTEYGGAYNEGVIFKVSTNGKESVLYSFTGNGGILNSTDGAYPEANLVQGTDGNFYGVTNWGGTCDEGTVFVVTPAGAETTLYSFTAPGYYANGCTSDGAVDGAFPTGLTQGSDGNFYGTAAGGANGFGVVFKLQNIIPGP